jgi:membrane-bound serine protease (ClpP class)
LPEPSLHHPTAWWDDAVVGNGRRVLALIGAAIAALTLVSLSARARAPSSRTVIELRLEGVVDPLVANYVRGGVGRANDEDDAAILLTIDTPGGLDSSMREIIEAINGSRVPVICYVSPSGARAASAGTFIMMGCPVAAMAPGTNIGAAHPVGVSGVIESQKVLNDAVATIRGLAQKYGRNADWAERAVRDSISASAPEALDLHVIDLIAPNVSALFADLQGRQVQTAEGGHATLDLEGATVEPRGLGALAGVVHALLDPNLAFIFFWLGLAFVVLEFFTPGGVLGTLGAVMLVMAFVTFGLLPVELIGVVLLIASVAFFVLELKHPGIGVPAIGGVVSLVLGGWFLFGSSVPSARVSPLVIAPTAAFATLFFLVVVRAAVRLRHRGVQTRDAALVGREGTVISDLAPAGVVQVASEEWSAEAVRGSPAKGERVRVVRMEGLRLIVEPAEEPATAAADREGRGS